MAVMSFNKSSKSIMSAVNYFESDKDHTNTIRKFKPIPMFGDRDRIEKLEKLAKESGIENTHTSLTISFRDNEFSEFKNPDGSYNQEKLIPAMKEIIKDFRETWFPGMKNDENFADFWNVHTDKGNIELNCAFLKMELTTGKAFNPFPPGELNKDMRDCYVDLLNDKFGFDRVVRNPFSISHNDMELKDIQNPSETAKRFKEVVKPKKNEIQKFITSQILDHKINSREELIETLQQHGEVKFLDKEEEALNQLKVSELKLLCTEHQLTIPSKAKKKDLVDILKSIPNITNQSLVAQKIEELDNKFNYGLFSLFMRTINFRGKNLYDLRRSEKVGVKKFKILYVFEEDKEFVEMALILKPNALHPVFPSDMSMKQPVIEF
jgi:hypothetical protein